MAVGLASDVVIFAARGTINRFHEAAVLIASDCLQTCGADRLDVNHMSDTQPKQRSEADAELEREIREGRKFTLEEAVGADGWPGRNERRIADHAHATSGA